MPLYLKNPNEVSLTATLEPLDEVKQYKVRTLLYSEYAYPHVRAVVRNRSAITGWMSVNDAELQDLDFVQNELQKIPPMKRKSDAQQVLYDRRKSTTTLIQRVVW